MKNWFVGVEQKTKKSGVSKRTKKRDKQNLENGIVKKITKKKNSLKSCVDYLLSKKHENHINTTIYEIGNARHDLNNILDEVGSVRLKNAATSFCASLPADLYHPSKDEWENIYHSTMEDYCDALNKELEKLEKAHHKKLIPTDERRKKEHHLNTERYAQRLDIDEMKRLSICVIHDDRNKPLIIGETSGSQMNLLISNVIGDQVVKIISQKKGIELFKKSYVNAVKNELGLEPKNYLTYEERPENEEHTKFYKGKSKVELLKLKPKTPRKKRKDQELRLKTEKKSYYKAINEKHNSLAEKEEEIEELKEKVLEKQAVIVDAKKAIGRRVDDLKTKESAVADKEFELNEKEEALDEKIGLLARVQKVFKSWVKCLFSENKQALAELALQSANAILDLEPEEPKVAKNMTILAQQEEDKAAMLGELKDETKVTYQVEKAQKEKKKRKKQTRTRTN
ncbi:TPA: hypothetical protein RQJ47_004419 [Vibrio vulnificus]|nr:hypothetical protein [Vibrio vulnificus]HDY8211285.1 hypothetical protein [Vibrio vulnificus]